MEPRFRVEFLQEAADFLEGLDPKAREKIYYNIKKSQMVNDAELFKKLTTDIWEFRTLYQGTCYRLFAFWDKSNAVPSLVVATHGLIKKTQKTPVSDLEKAERLRKQYENERS